MDRSGQGHPRPAPPDTLRIRSQKKTPAEESHDLGLKNGGLKGAFEHFFDLARPAFRQQRTFERARRLALSLLLCMGRHTVTGMLCAGGQQFHDWTADYRLFEQRRIDTEKLFAAVLAGVKETLPTGAPIVGAIDDTLRKKRGPKIDGASWRYDPLGPPFSINFIWASRFLQLSLAMPEQAAGPSSARMIPVDLTHCPSPHKPGKMAGEEEWKEWKSASEQAAISRKGAERIAALRRAMDDGGMADRPLVMTADGTFTCSAVMKHLPPRTVLVGRIRKDACLYALPTAEEENPGRGRKRVYGERLQTPEQIRQDDTIPWQEVRAHAAGKEHTFNVKEIPLCRWKSAGRQNLRLIVIRPLGYRLTKQGPINYRSPAYLIATDTKMALGELLQAYLWRWEIEVNFRDEKTLLGMGQAQVWRRESVETLTPFVAAAYAMLLLALEKTGGKKRTLPAPLWQKPDPENLKRTSTGQAQRELRAEVWGEALGGGSKTDFASLPPRHAKPPKIENCAASAVCYATG